jgi:hypothetical protein
MNSRLNAPKTLGEVSQEELIGPAISWTIRVWNDTPFLIIASHSFKRSFQISVFIF